MNLPLPFFPYPIETGADKFNLLAQRLHIGRDQFLLLSVESPTGDVFASDFLARLQRLGEALAEVEGVHHVLSLANALHVESRDDDIYIGPFFEEVRLAAGTDCAYAMPFESRRPIFVCRRARITLDQLWSRDRHFI